MFVIFSANLNARLCARAHKSRKHKMIRKWKWNKAKQNVLTYVGIDVFARIKCVFVSCHTVTICLACILESFPIMLFECAGSFSNGRGDYHRLTHANTNTRTHTNARARASSLLKRETEIFENEWIESVDCSAACETWRQCQMNKTKITARETNKIKYALCLFAEKKGNAHISSSFLIHAVRD